MKQHIINHDDLELAIAGALLRNNYDFAEHLRALKPVERMTDEQITKIYDITFSGWKGFARAIENHHFGSEE